jgi:mycofactocin biosynthetic radical S-adenosylmethionine protein MftC
VSYHRLLGQVWEGNILFSALLELTYRCNLDCFFCYNDPTPHGKELNLSQYRKLFEDLRRLGTMNLAFSGGEPLEHPHFFMLGSWAKAQGFVVRVKSNGYALRESLAQRLLEEVDPFAVELSLHGATAQTHDHQTRVPGSFERLLLHVEGMARLGLRMQFNAVLTAWNEHQIEEMFALADSLEMRIEFDTRLTPRDNGDREPLQIAPSMAAVERLFALQSRRVQTAPPEQPTLQESEAKTDEVPPVSKHCGAGSSGVTVDPWGNVYPCVQWRRKAGNLHDQSIREIWEKSPVLTEIRRLTRHIHQQVKYAGPCFDKAGFCPGLAEQMSGAAVKFDEDTFRRRDILVHLKRKNHQLE